MAGAERVVEVYTTSLLSNPRIRGAHERVLRGLSGARIAYAVHDVASDEECKKRWKRLNGGNNELPCITVDGQRVGVSPASALMLSSTADTARRALSSLTRRTSPTCALAAPEC